MKRSYKILASALVLGAVVYGGVMATTASASLEDQKAATQAVTDYVKAFESQDIDTMTKYVKDARVKDAAALHAKYEQYEKANKEDHATLKLIRVEKSTNGKFMVTFEQSSDKHKAAQFTLPVSKENDAWKILIDGSVVVDTKK